MKVIKHTWRRKYSILDIKTEIVAVIVYQGKVKSGGYAKYNIADHLNSNPHGKAIEMYRSHKGIDSNESMSRPICLY